MALNKKMHSRNIYKVPPNFKELALQNEEFRQFAKVDIRGKVSIDFKDPAALRALTRALLLRDWGLDVIIPANKLVPTLPLRLNYVLWIEDLLRLCNSDKPVYGIDIGTGSSCIYPLLAAKKNLWHMIGTEKDSVCFSFAKDNVERNNLQSLVTVFKVSGKTIFQEIFENDACIEAKDVYDFSMCNPPFFASDGDIDTNKSNRSQCRAPPHNARTGSSHEVAVTGGEVAFVLQMVEESLLLKSRIRIFSTMVGHKASVPLILSALTERGVQEVARTEFCQGRVTRWGIAWSFSVSLSHIPVQVVASTKKQKPPMSYEVPPVEILDGETQLKAILRRLKHLLDKLEMQYKQVAKGVSSIGYQVTAHSNTWSNQRRRRRENSRKNRTDDLEAKTSEQNQERNQCEINRPKSPCIDDVDEERVCINEMERMQGTSQDQGEKARSVTLGEEPPCKKVKSCTQLPLLVFSIVVHEEVGIGSEGTKVVMEVDLLKGGGDREMLHQVMQYFRNNLCDKSLSTT